MSGLSVFAADAANSEGDPQPWAYTDAHQQPAEYINDDNGGDNWTHLSAGIQDFLTDRRSGAEGQNHLFVSYAPYWGGFSQGLQGERGGGSSN